MTSSPATPKTLQGVGSIPVTSMSDISFSSNPHSGRNIIAGVLDPTSPGPRNASPPRSDTAIWLCHHRASQ